MEMILKALVIICVGMTIVFLFLQILIITVQINYKILHNLGLDKEEPEPAHTFAPTGGEGKKKSVISAITAAVKVHEATK